MAKRQTEGWAVYRPAQGDLGEAYYYNNNGAPYKRRSDAVRKLRRVERWLTVELQRITMFYETDNET